MTEELQKTPLYGRHVEHGGKMVPFAGFLLPVQYEAGVIGEHRAVRENVGLFDVSHMGEVTFKGPDALSNIQRLLCNDYSTLADGRVRYSPMLNVSGGVIDDVLVYRKAQDDYMMVVNAANRHKDVAHIFISRFGNAEIEDISDGICQLALQGPRAERMMQTITNQLPQKYYSFIDSVKLDGMDCLISRTGYTGEDGFELYVKAEDGEKLFDLLYRHGRNFGLQLCGLGCRDTLRLEAAMPLYGHEMDDTVTPPETGLDRFVKMDKDDFIGRRALLEMGKPRRARIGLKITGRGIAREHCPVIAGGKEIGMTTSGTHCPTMGAVAMALVDAAWQEPGQTVQVVIRNNPVDAKIVPLPFYHKK
ncbi:MAG: glycine cleavage system aminomethyltransferase GcvT [Clostridiales bacterium]|nr:glycine cleavage system aminomethyltransferase GcvT [Clostridiales bacterium]